MIFSNFKNVNKLFILGLLILFFGCGRKPKNVFVFKPKLQEIALNRLSFAPVKCIAFRIDGQKKELIWNNVDSNFDMSFLIKGTAIVVKKNVELLGYNVYRFVKKAFVPEDPINKKILKSNYYQVSSSKKYKWCYLVRAVFKVDQKIIEGPSSQILCEN